MNELRELRIEPDASTLEALRAWLAPVRQALGGRFRAAYVTGSALVDGFDPKRSRVNLLVIASELGADALRAVASAAPRPKKPPFVDPLFLTEAQIEKSLDVFPIEWLEIRERHLLLEGEPVVEKFEVPRANLRLQCEHELRSKHIRLRQSYLALHGDSAALAETLAASASGFATLFRTLLRLRGDQPPASSAHVVERVADAFHVDASALLVPHLVRHGGGAPHGDVAGGYLRFLEALERLIAGIDTFRVS